jgi:hypothetical protein
MTPDSVRDTGQPRCDIAEVERAVGVLFDADQVVELRAFRGRRDVTTGFFDDHAALSREAARLSGRWDGVYVTLQRINPALLARRANRMETGGAGTSDNDVRQYRWLPLDFDPVRPADVSSSDEEHALALARAHNALDWLESEGFEQYVMADSGNGAHVLVPTDCAVEEKAKIQGFVSAVSEQFSDARVKVDGTVFNPARVWKLYGTQTRKGDDFKGGPGNPARRHRLARLVEVRL